MQKVWSAAPVVNVMLVLIAAWWLATAAQLVSGEFLPAPGDVASRAVLMMSEPYGDSTLPEHAFQSGFRILAGYAAGCLAGFVFGLLIVFVRPVGYVVDPILRFLRPIPALAFVPIFLVWFGLGDAPAIALIFFAVFTSMTVYAVSAMEALPGDLHDAARSLGANRWQVFRHVRMPAATPDLLSGMRVMVALAWTSVMGAELIGAYDGLGWMIWRGSRFLDAEVIFVGVIVIALLGGTMDMAIHSVNNALTGQWRRRVRTD